MGKFAKNLRKKNKEKKIYFKIEVRTVIHQASQAGGCSGDQMLMKLAKDRLGLNNRDLYGYFAF